jgi:NADP-reducing hydrogenase subunit HndB
MKTLAELKAIRDRAREQVDLRRDDAGTRIVVGMATCGIAAGARPVMLQFIEEINRRGLKDVTVSQTGCIGMCRLEPMVEVYTPDNEKVTYVKVKPEMVGRIVAEHIVNGAIVKDYTIGAAESDQA